MDAHVHEHVGFLLQGGQRGLMHHTPVLVVIVHEVASASLDQQVHLVPHEIPGCTLHGEVGPVSPLHTVQVLVVLDHSETVAQGFSVQQGVQCVAGHGQETRGTLRHTRVLFLRQVVYSH